MTRSIGWVAMVNFTIASAFKAVVLAMALVWGTQPWNFWWELQQVRTTQYRPLIAKGPEHDA